MEVVSTKWMATAAGIWIQCSCGASYAFGIYSSVLKSSQGYDQSTLDTVSVFKDIGANAGVLAGLLYSAVAFPGRGSGVLGGGPWVVILAGAIQSFVGYFVIWCSVVGLIPPLPVPVMCFFIWMAAHMQTFFSTANVVTGVHNFGDYGGTIVGIMKGLLGLSGAVLIQFYHTVCQDNPSSFILLLALTPSLVSVSLMLFVRNYNTITKHDKKHLNSFSVVTLIIAAYLSILILLENVYTMPLWGRISTFTLLLVLLASPLGIAIRAHSQEYNRFERALLAEQGCHANSARSSKFPTAEDAENSRELPACDEGNKNLFHSLCSFNFWLLFIAMFCALGTGMATINNISQVGESLGYKATERNSLVAMWSIWNFLGRFGAGFVSDIFLHRSAWGRPIFMSVTLATMGIGHIVIASGFSKNLYLGTLLVGISYGSQWSLMPTIISETYGLRDMGTLFNTIGIACPIASYIFSVRVIGYFYDSLATDDGDNKCFGTHCFMSSFMILASFAFCGALVALMLYFRTRKFYREVVFERLQH